MLMSQIVVLHVYKFYKTMPRLIILTWNEISTDKGKHWRKKKSRSESDF
jgi:hypothetical protein